MDVSVQIPSESLAEDFMVLPTSPKWLLRSQPFDQSFVK